MMESCMCCGASEDFKLLLEIGIDVKSGKKLRTSQIYECQHCRMGRLTPTPSSKEIAESYDLDAYYTQGESHIKRLQPTILDRVLTKIAWTLDHSENRRDVFRDVSANLSQGAGQSPVALEVGCGSGKNLEFLKTLGWDVVGVEPDPVSRALALENGIQVHEGTAEQLPEPVTSMRFDLIILSHVLEHTVDPVRSLRNLQPLIRESGVLYCEVPNCSCLHFTKFNQISEMLDVPRHLNFFTKRSIEQLCAKVGLSIRDWKYSGFNRHHDPSWRAWENSIHDSILESGQVPTVPKHSFMASVLLLVQSMFAAPEKKYDSIAIVATTQT